MLTDNNIKMCLKLDEVYWTHLTGCTNVLWWARLWKFIFVNDRESKRIQIRNLVSIRSPMIQNTVRIAQI